MKQYSTKSLFATGFMIIIILLIILLIAWTKSVHSNQNRFQNIVNRQLETRMLSEMIYATQRRSLNLYRMSVLDDPFEIDEEYLEFRDLGDTYLKAREKILAGDLTDEARAAFRSIDGLAGSSGQRQLEVIDYIIEEKPAAAHELLGTQITPIQKQIHNLLSIVFDAQQDIVEQQLAAASQQNSNSYLLIGSLGTVAILLAIFTVIVVKKTATTEAQLIDQGNRVRALYQASSVSGEPSEQIVETLRMGCRLLGMEIGKVCRIDTSKGTNTFLYTVAPPNSPVKTGTVIPLDDAFYNDIFNSGNDVLINLAHTNGSDYSNNPSDEFSPMGSYITMPIWINGEKFGTVNFASLTKKNIPFTTQDEQLIKLIANWVSATLERQYAQEDRLAKQIAEAANHTKSAFLSNMSHEFRTPLNAILGYNDLLKEDVERNNHDQYLGDISKIKLAGKHLLSLISDILDLSKIEAGKIELLMEEFPLEPLIMDVINASRPHAEKNHNHLTVQITDKIGSITSDVQKIRQILFSLLNNACKFTANGNINLSVNKFATAQGDRIQFLVNDNGIGIHNDQIEKLFISFSQGNPEITNKYGGTGVGLAISYRLCQLIGGTINVCSEFGKGTTFCVTLPARVFQPPPI